jgi:hypothetical protein
VPAGHAQAHLDAEYYDSLGEGSLLSDRASESLLKESVFQTVKFPLVAYGL